MGRCMSRCAAAPSAGTFEMIELTAYMSLGLAVFNLIPLPPLDGSKVLFALMSDESYYKLMRYERYGGLVLMVLMMTGVLESLSPPSFPRYIHI